MTYSTPVSPQDPFEVFFDNNSWWFFDEYDDLHGPYSIEQAAQQDADDTAV